MVTSPAAFGSSGHLQLVGSVVLQDEQILWRILAASPEVLGNISGGWGCVLAGLKIWLVLQEEDTILLLYELLEARLRAIHLHSATDAPLNVTFIRAASNALLKVDIPIVYRGEDISPGLRKGAYLNTIKRTVKYLCPADVIPPFIDVDLSELDVGQKLVMGDLKVHPALKLLQSKEEPVCKIMGARVSDQKKSK
nr:uncharacterized protein LOC111983166 [Quercus suber]XP_023889887.1 uncharacterized protein LOC112001944 [Quercus suber]